ncbi:MAG: hypothetical protein U0271_33925 [Polyangiaceae bacterium]
MSMSEIAGALLAAQQVSSRITEVRACELALADLAQKRAHAGLKVSRWDRAVFFHTTPDEAQLEALVAAERAAEHALASAVAAFDAALRACWVYPPIEIVHRVEWAIGEVLSNRAVGRDVDANRAVADTLEGIADRVIALWAPNVDLAALAAQLNDDAARRAAAQRDPGPPPLDANLGWALIDGAQLFARVARALEGSRAFADARARLDPEWAQYRAATAALESADARVTARDELTRGEGLHEGEARLRREASERAYASLCDVVDELRLAVVRAFGAHPVMRVHFALLGAASAARANAARAILLACLVEVRRACEEAFVDIPNQVWPRGREKLSGPPAHSPYRSQGASLEESAAPEPVDARAAFRARLSFFAAVEESRARTILTFAVASASVLGLLRRHFRDVDLPVWERLLFDRDERREAERSHFFQRIAVHQGLLARHAEAALAETAPLVEEHHPLAGLNEAFTRAVHATRAITPPGAYAAATSQRQENFMRRYASPPNKELAERWVAKLDEILTKNFPVGGNRAQWIDALCRRLQGPRPIREPEEVTSYEHVIERLAARLQDGPFLRLAEIAWRTRDVRHGEHEATCKEMGLLLDAALEAYPPLALFEKLGTLRSALEALQAWRTPETAAAGWQSAWFLVGQPEALEALEAWGRKAMRIFGPLPTAGDALEQWVAREL